jgi:hypothetical protein
MARVVVVLVLQVMEMPHQELLAAQVVLAAAEAVAEPHLAQVAQEYFTFSTRRHYERNYL